LTVACLPYTLWWKTLHDASLAWPRRDRLAAGLAPCQQCANEWGT